MREMIRFAWGISSLGDFLVAMSDKGLVALEFSSDHSATEHALCARFPAADVTNNQQDLSDVLEGVKRAIEEPVRSCGTDFQSLLKLRAHVRNVILAHCGEPGIAELVKPET